MNLTNLKQLFDDEDAVSPVIGVILMVAITVILAAVIGTFVLGLGENVQDSAPQANFQFEYGGDWSGTTGTVTITHTGGEDVDPATLSVSFGGVETVDTFAGDWATDPVSTGSAEIIGESTSTGADETLTNDISTGSTVRVIWTSPSGSNSNTIGQSTVPS